MSKENPDRRVRALLWVLESSLRGLQRALRNGKRVRWSSPSGAFQYPVQWDWEQWRRNKYELAVQYRKLTSRNTRTRKSAVRTLAQMMVPPSLFDAAIFDARGFHLQARQLPAPDGAGAYGRSGARLEGWKKQIEKLEELFFPFSIGAAEIELPEGLEPGQKIPRKLAEQLKRKSRSINVPELVYRASSDGHPIAIRIIFQVFPLTIEDRPKRAYFPMTVGVMVTSEEPLPANQASRPIGLIRSNGTSRNAGNSGTNSPRRCSVVRPP